MLNARIWMQMIFCIGVWTVPIQAQLSLQYARGFRVDYFDDYRVVTVFAPGGGAQEKDSVCLGAARAGVARWL